uniref:trypsin n=1 Tax=Anoplopoma fimbria TaxID=229290 RepID=C3KHI3_ANOFI|nr:Tryptase-2 precursor [Anoplopoma fimbria]
MAFGALLAGLVLIHTGGLLGAEVRSSIIGGEDAKRDNWPWMVHLNITDEKKNWRCGGTILNENWVLSAASCWQTNNQISYKKTMIWAGAYNLKKGAKEYLGIEFYMNNPGFKELGEGHYVNDIALVKLKYPVDTSGEIKAVNLPDPDAAFDSSSECWIIGWGDTKGNTYLASPETLQQLKTTIIPQKKCKAKNPYLAEGVMCAGDKAEGKDACTGDYGGPLVCKTAGGYVQVGIMSYSSCGVKGNPGFYTEVSKFREYINNYIHKP